VEESRGVRPGDATRPGDIVVQDFVEGCRHLIMDGVVTIVYRNIIISKVAAVPGFTAKQVEDNKLKAGAYSPRPVAAAHGGRHMLVLFAMKDGGRIGAHGQAALRMLAEYAVTKRKFPPATTPLNTPYNPGCGSHVGTQVMAAPLSFSIPPGS